MLTCVIVFDSDATAQPESLCESAPSSEGKKELKPVITLAGPVRSDRQSFAELTRTYMING